MGGDRRLGGQAGQGTIEWIGLVLLVALLVVGAVAALGPRVPRGALARVVAERMICAVEPSDACAGETELASAYGPEVAALAAERTPGIRYERGIRSTTRGHNAIEPRSDCLPPPRVPLPRESDSESRQRLR